MKKLRVLFFRPDYHSSFALVDGLRQLGHKADIYVPWNYPTKLLYSQRDIKRLSKFNERLYENCLNPPKSTLLRKIAALAYYLSEIIEIIWLALKYDVVYFYGSFDPVQIPLLSILKRLKKRMFLFPSGCKDEDSKATWLMEDNGNVCGNCGFFDRCTDENNVKHFNIARKYMNGVSGAGYRPSSQFEVIPFRSKAIYLDLWKPEAAELMTEDKSRVKIMHSFASNGRDFGGKNIKGSPYVLKAIDNMVEDGLSVELFYVTDTPSNQMRFKQAKADIIVDQLIYGWWGSTALEGMALGKPVVCYLNPKFEANFYKAFPEYEGRLPIVRANTSNIEEVLRTLVNDGELRKRLGQESREFAESFLDPDRATQELLKFFT
jgi:glycosyltransferase involved in cell wall biosynthesis